MSVHPTDDDLDHYLHRSAPPAHLSAVRRHLDACAPCWDRWNRHRWDAARCHPLHADLAAFLGPAFEPYLDSSRALAAEWDRADPRAPDEVATFFRTSTNYLYNLVIWEASGNRPDYLSPALPHLAAHDVRTVLEIGSGIGTDALALHRHGYAVTTCDHDSPSTRFARHRHGSAIPRIEPTALRPIHAGDALWIIDTLDHLSDPAAVLDPLLPHTRVVITEDVRDIRAHGCQRFHLRRPLAETTVVFARHELIPLHQGPTTIWTRMTRRRDLS